MHGPSEAALRGLLSGLDPSLIESVRRQIVCDAGGPPSTAPLVLTTAERDLIGALRSRQNALFDAWAAERRAPKEGLLARLEGACGEDAAALGDERSRALAALDAFDRSILVRFGALVDEQAAALGDLAVRCAPHLDAAQAGPLAVGRFLVRHLLSL